MNRIAYHLNKSAFLPCWFPICACMNAPVAFESPLRPFYKTIFGHSSNEPPTSLFRANTIQGHDRSFTQHLSRKYVGGRTVGIGRHETTMGVTIATIAWRAATNGRTPVVANGQREDAGGGLGRAARSPALQIYSLSLRWGMARRDNLRRRERERWWDGRDGRRCET